MKIKSVCPYLIFSIKSKPQEIANEYLEPYLSLRAFGDEKYHIMVRPIICDYIGAHRLDSKSSNWRNGYLFKVNEESEMMDRKYWTSDI